jgi:ribose 5-phosphate isomerase A
MSTDIESAKRKAAFAAVDKYIHDGMVVGIGSGSTIVHAVDRLAQRVKEEKWQRTICIPSSFQATQLINEHGLFLGDLTRYPEIDVAIDGADEVDANLQAIKGGGGCCTQEKIVASCAKQFVIVADHRKESQTLGQKWKAGVPIEVIPLAHVPVARRLTQQLGARSACLRMAGASKAGPVVTDNGNFLLDADFGEIPQPHQLNSKLLCIPGVVETGLFVDMATAAYFGQADGSVVVRNKPT